MLIMVMKIVGPNGVGVVVVVGVVVLAANYKFCFQMNQVIEMITIGFY